VAIALAGSVYVLSGILLLIGIFWFVKRDAAAMQAELEQEAAAQI
jgi:hypothetical protein